MTGFLPWPEGDDHVMQCGDGHRPRVSTNGERVVKVYCLGPSASEEKKRRLRSEGEMAVSLSGIPGVVTTFGAYEIGDEYVIEMELLGDPLSRYLESETSLLPTISRERWGLLFEQVAYTLEEVHRRGYTHQDIKPGNLLFDRTGERLVVTDFSVSSRRTRLWPADGRVQLAGTPPYVAPEQYEGRNGPKVDQFALGRTATQILGSDQSPQTKRILLRATSQEPEERFARIADFGAALRSTLSDDAPRLSTRLQTLPPEVRHAWAPAIATTAITYLAIVLLRDPRLNVLGGIVLPLVAGLVMQAVLTLAFRLIRRTQPWLKVANRAWFPPAVAGSFIAVLSPMIKDNPEANGEYVLYAAIAAFGLTIALGSVPRDAGEWLVRIVGYWERWADTHPLARWPAVGCTTALIGLLAMAPVEVADRWPRVTASSEIATPEPIAVVAQLREAMLTGEARQICTLVSVPVSAGVAPCADWAPVAAQQLQSEVRSGGPRFVPPELDRIEAEYRPRSTLYGGTPGWGLHTSGEDREYLGWVTRPIDSQTVWTISVTRVVKRDKPLLANVSEWKYEIVLRQGAWRVSAVAVCDYRTERVCETLSQLSPEELEDYRRDPL